ncbi:odorant receptor 131-2-like [Gastrophryne carolinensis]
MRIIFMILVVTSFSFYFFFVAVILLIYFGNSQMRENVRYILFIHLLFNDTVKILFSFVLFATALYAFRMPMSLCCIIAAISTASTLITPYTLALMSLERHIAICYPLRHGEICSIPRCNIAIAVMWVVGGLPIITELMILVYYVNKRYFLSQTICIWSGLEMYPVQVNIRYISLSLSFGVVGLTIIYTYIRVMMVAKKIGSKTSSASRAGRTVLLHAFQLFLCLLSFTTTFTEAVLKYYYAMISVINFFVFICLLQYISPLVYGMRDELILKCIRRMFTCN